MAAHDRDGRYKLARYYAPAAFNSPQTPEEILQNNDVQLFDLESDPEEMRNLALDPENNRATILRMNSLLGVCLSSHHSRAQLVATHAIGG